MNHKYILLSLLLISSNLVCMEQEKRQSFLPEKLRKIIIENSFFQTDESLEPIIEIIDWKWLSKEEIDIIYNILSSEFGNNITKKILVFISNLQSLFLCIEDDTNDNHQSSISSSRLNSFILLNDLLKTVAYSRDNSTLIKSAKQAL